jgi:hypothetical protein
MQRSIYDDRTEALTFGSEQLSLLVARTRQALKGLGYTIRKRNQRPEWLIIAPNDQWALLTYSQANGWEVKGPADESDKLAIADTIRHFIIAVSAYETRARESKRY